MTTNPDTSKSRKLEALDLFYQSVAKPDHELRNEAHDLNCYDELMQIREYMLELLEDMRTEEQS